MGDPENSKLKLPGFVTKFVAPFLGTISLITTVHGFVKLFTEKDATLVTVISLMVGILLLWVICLYYAFVGKQQPSPQILTATGKPIKSQPDKDRLQRWLRHFALAGVIAIPLLTLGGWGYWQHLQNQPSKDILILVADFEAKDDQNYFVTKTIFENLESAVEPYPDVKVKRLNKSFQESKDAREEGEKQKASILIWGSYGTTKEIVPISANFELLMQNKFQPELAPEVKGKVRTAALSDLDSFTLQTELSKEMTYLTLVAIGTSRYAARDWKDAIAKFTDALKQTPPTTISLNRAIVHFYRANAQYVEHELSEAIADYDTAIQLYPNRASFYNNRGLSKKRYDEQGALQDYEKAININPKLTVAYYNRADLKADSNNMAGVIEDYNIILGINPVDPNAYNNRGVAKAAVGDKDGARKDYDIAISINPKLSNAYYNRANLKISLRDIDSAISDYNKAIEIDKKYYNAYNNRGVAKSLLGDEEAAIADYEKAIELGSRSAVFYNNKGLVISANQQNGGFVRSRDEFFVISNDDFIELGSIYYEPVSNISIDSVSKDPIVYYDASISKDSSLSAAYYNRGNLKYNLGDFRESTVDYTRAIQNNQNWGEHSERYFGLATAYFERGKAKESLRDINGAISDYSQAIQTKADYADVYYQRGLVYQSQGDIKNATADFKKVFQLTQDPALRKKAEESLKKLKINP